MSNNSNKLSFKEKIKKWYAGSKEKFKNWFSEFKVDFKEKTQQKWRDIKKNTNITRELVKKNIKIQYRNSAIGAIWTVLNPLLNMLVMYFVFGTVLKYNETDKTYALYLLCGNIIFNMMRAATTQSLTSLVANRGLLTKNKISYYVFPVSNNLSAVVNFFFSCIALFGVMLVIWFRGNPVFSWNFLLAFLMLPALFLFNYGLSMILASLYVFFRDIQHFYGVFLTLWTYLTPIFYKTDKFTGASGKILMAVINLNPMYHFVEYFRDVIYRCSVTGADLPSVGKLAALYMIGVVFFGVGTLIYNLTKRKFIFYI